MARGRFGNSWRGRESLHNSSRRPVLCLVKRRNRDALIAVIKKHVRAGTLVVHDEWRAYVELK
ncbi:hypothetical protein N1851_020187 [Merluccius polli]|uniref:ISXO2-like transposase domain-containing protein n=1 Tax=Merluccius polli TaxID=89951 RepID=A0AA47ML86_MERPO|nr:hypothetical protein N1851_020187 [Merluccius polli]